MNTNRHVGESEVGMYVLEVSSVLLSHILKRFSGLVVALRYIDNEPKLHRDSRRGQQIDPVVQKAEDGWMERVTSLNDDNVAWSNNGLNGVRTACCVIVVRDVDTPAFLQFV